MRCTSGMASTSWSTQIGMTLSTGGVTGDRIRLIRAGHLP